jgi:hypothetical protein
LSLGIPGFGFDFDLLKQLPLGVRLLAVQLGAGAQSEHQNTHQAPSCFHAASLTNYIHLASIV